MTTLSPNFVRWLSIFIALFLIGGSLFWDGWSFSGPLYSVSFWLQPMVFLYAFGCLMNSVVRLLLDAQEESIPVTIEIEIEQNYIPQQSGYTR